MSDICYLKQDCVSMKEEIPQYCFFGGGNLLRKLVLKDIASLYFYPQGKRNGKNILLTRAASYIMCLITIHCTLYGGMDMFGHPSSKYLRRWTGL